MLSHASDADENDVVENSQQLPLELIPQFDVLHTNEWRPIEVRIDSEDVQSIQLITESPTELLTIVVDHQIVDVSSDQSQVINIQARRSFPFAVWRGGDFEATLSAWTSQGDHAIEAIKVRVRPLYELLLLLLVPTGIGVALAFLIARPVAIVSQLLTATASATNTVTRTSTIQPTETQTITPSTSPTRTLPPSPTTSPTPTLKPSSTIIMPITATQLIITFAPTSTTTQTLTSTTAATFTPTTSPTPFTNILTCNDFPSWKVKNYRMEAGETISGLLARSVNDPLVKQVLEVNRIADPRSIREGARIDCLPHLFKLKLNSVVIEGQPLCNHDFIVQVSVSNVGTERWDGGVITLDDTDGGQLGTIPIGSIEPNVPSIFTHTVHAAGSPYQQHTLYARFTGLSGDQREQRTIYMLGCSPMADFTFVGNEGNVEGHITGTITSTSIAVTTYQWTVIVYQDLEGKGPQEGPTYQFSSPSFAIDILVDNDYRHYIEINLVATGYGSVDTCRKVYRGDWSTHDIIFVSEDCTK